MLSSSNPCFFAQKILSQSERARDNLRAINREGKKHPEGSIFRTFPPRFLTPCARRNWYKCGVTHRGSGAGLPTYSVRGGKYGNGCCDGVSPCFPCLAGLCPVSMSLVGLLYPFFSLLSSRCEDASPCPIRARPPCLTSMPTESQSRCPLRFVFLLPEELFSSFFVPLFLRFC